MLLPTSCFAPISYVQEMVMHSNVEILGGETYPKQTERNRFSIATSQGIQTLTIPINRIDGSKTISSRIEIDHQTDWQKKHWKAIETAYNSSPYFDHYSQDLKELLFQKEKNLLQFNLKVMERILLLFDFEVKISVQDEFQVIDHESFRFNTEAQIHSYQQVLFKSTEFIPNLSIIDLLCCEGPIGRKILISH
jgi:hypothetical protein